jgi:hypothetical protein
LTGDKYTFEAWTTGGAGGQKAHQQLTYISAKYARRSPPIRPPRWRPTTP